MLHYVRLLDWLQVQGKVIMGNEIADVMPLSDNSVGYSLKNTKQKYTLHHVLHLRQISTLLGGETSFAYKKLFTRKWFPVAFTINNP